MDFNPRSLTGATVKLPTVWQYSTISIHAPLRERQLCTDDSVIRVRISIHAPLRERLWSLKLQGSCSNFNPRSLTGATPGSTSLPSLTTFQSTLPYGSDMLVTAWFVMLLLFQSTLPYGSDGYLSSDWTMGNHISIHAPLRERPRR